MPKAITRIGIPVFLIFGLIMAVVALFSASGQPEVNSGYKRFAVGDLSGLQFNATKPLPTGAIEGPDGEETSLAAFQGAPIVLNIWNESCAPCEAEMPSLAKLQEAVAEQGVKVLAVAVDREGNKEFNRDSLQRLSGGVLEFYFDKNFGVAYDTAAVGLPTTILYDANGGEIARKAGGADWASENAVAFVKAIAAQS